jgi:hypothetical protein
MSPIGKASFTLHSSCEWVLDYEDWNPWRGKGRPVPTGNDETGTKK